MGYTENTWSIHKWVYGSVRLFYGNKYIACVDNSDDTEEQHERDARRIAACLTRCEGISTEDLERGNAIVLPRASKPIDLSPDRNPLETPE
jgi:hypothetical protein